MKKITEFLAINKSMFAVLFVAVFVGMGERIAERFLPIYLISLGASSLIPGFLNALTNFLGAIYSYPSGWLTDKIGYKKSLLVFNVLAILGYGIVIVFPSWIAVIVGSIFFLSWSSLSLPAIMDLVSKVVPKNKHTMGISMHSLIRRIPMALGPIIGGILIDKYGVVQGTRFAFMLALCMGLIAIIVQQILIHDSSVRPINNNVNIITVFKSMPMSLKHLLISDIFIRFCEQIPYAYIAIWAMEIAGGAKVSAMQFGVLTSIEMFVALIIYIPVAYYADKKGKKNFVAITFFNFTVFPLFLYFSRSFSFLIVAFIIRGLKEFGEATRKSLILDLSSPALKASSFGCYYLIRDTIVSVAALCGAFLWKYSPELNLFTATLFGIIGTLYFVVFGTDSSSNQVVE